MLTKLRLTWLYIFTLHKFCVKMWLPSQVQQINGISGCIFGNIFYIIQTLVCTLKPVKKYFKKYNFTSYFQCTHFQWSLYLAIFMIYQMTYSLLFNGFHKIQRIRSSLNSDTHTIPKFCMDAPSIIAGGFCL